MAYRRLDVLAAFAVVLLGAQACPRVPSSADPPTTPGKPWRSATDAPPAPTGGAPAEALGPLTLEPGFARFEYVADDGPLANPERGMYTRVNLLDDELADYSSLTSLLHSYVRLDAYRDQQLDQELLEALGRALGRVRASGKKIILRFAYNFGPYPACEPDADEAQAIQHVQQLAPVLNDNADVIAWFEAGFIGCWGEWHSSTHSLDKSQSAKLHLVGQMLESWPPLPIQIRYPSDLRLLRARLPAGSATERLGFHNDCVFASDPDDYGTWGRGGDSVTSDKSYVTSAADTAPTGGETCHLSGRSTCATAMLELPAQHWTDLNGGFASDVLQQLADQGCLPAIESRLGYRFRLLEATLPLGLARGAPLKLTVRLANEGWARAYSKRGVYVILAHGDERYPLETDVDVRSWAPGAEARLEANVSLPEAAADGLYRVGLWLPDAAERLATDPRYAVRFANAGVWDDSGVNWLAEKLRVGDGDFTGEAGGSNAGAGGDGGGAGGDGGGAGDGAGGADFARR